MNCATTNGMKSGAEIILSNLDREGVNDAGGLDADMNDAFYCCDEVAWISEPTVRRRCGCRCSSPASFLLSNTQLTGFVVQGPRASQRCTISKDF